MKTIIRYTSGREWLFVAASLFFTALQVKLELLFPEYLRRITVLIQSDTIDLAALTMLCTQMLAFVAGALVCAILTALFVAVVASTISARIRQGVFDKIMDFSLEEVATFSTPSLITRCTFDVMQVQIFITSVPTMLTRAVFTGIMATLGIWGTHPIWTSITGGSVVLMFVLLTLLIVLMTPAT